MSEWEWEERHRLIEAVEKIANNQQAQPSTDKEQLIMTQKMFLGTLLGAAEFITGVLGDPSLDVIKKHTELRKLVQRLGQTAQRVEEDMNNNGLGKLPHSFDV